MNVEVLSYTNLEVADAAISKCWDSPSKGAGHMIERMDRVGNKNKHGSTLEHIYYTFDIDGISRGCLQELVRHRIASYSVKSTRYTLKELKEADNLDTFFVHTNDQEVDEAIHNALWDLQDLIKRGISNDIIKYLLPEAYKTSLVMTINMRSLQNFLKLRMGKAAHWEIRDLASAMYTKIPDDHKFMYVDSIDRTAWESYLDNNAHIYRQLEMEFD